MLLLSFLSLVVGLGSCFPLGPKPRPPDPFCPALPQPPGRPFPTPPFGHKLKMVGLTIGTQKYSCNPYNMAGPPVPEKSEPALLYDLSPFLNDKELLRKVATKAVFSMAFPKSTQFGKMDWDFGLGGPVMYGGPLQKAIFRGPIASYHSPPQDPLTYGLDNEPPLSWARFNYSPEDQSAKPQIYSDIAYRVHTVGGSAPDSCEGLPPTFMRRTASQWYFYYPKDSQGMRGVTPSRQLCIPPPPLWMIWEYL